MSFTYFVRQLFVEYGENETDCFLDYKIQRCLAEKKKKKLRLHNRKEKLKKYANFYQCWLKNKGEPVKNPRPRPIGVAVCQ